MSEAMRCLNCGYVLWGLPAGACPECGRYFDPEISATFTHKPPFVRWRYWLPAFAFAVGGGILLYLLLLWLAGWGWAVTIVSPIALGIIIGYGCRVQLWIKILLSLIALTVIVFALFSFSLVGAFCGLVLAGVALVPTLVGVCIGTLLRFYLKQTAFEQRWYLPMLSIAGAVISLGLLDHLTHRAYAIEQVATSVEIPATIGRAWNSVMFYEEVHHAPPWLLRLGLPRPLYTRGSVEHVGDCKTCVYSKGRLVKRVSERVPDHRLAFDVIAQENFENHSIRLTDGSFDFAPVGSERTRVTLTTRYEPKLGPRLIWRPVEEIATHTLHRHVLEGMRRKAAEEP